MSHDTDPSQPRTPMADLIIDTARLVLGDCLGHMRAMPANCIDLTVTSPPYDDLRKYNGYSFDFENIARELYRITKPGGVVVWVVGDATVKGSETGTSFRQALHFKEIGFNLHDTMIFKKGGTGACGSIYAYWQAFEYMFVLSKGRPNTINKLKTGKLTVASGARNRKEKGGATLRRFETGRESTRDNVWQYCTGVYSGDERTPHPAVFPEQLAADHIASWSNPGDIVFDPFTGSGTTGKMAVRAGRKFIGIEISDQYLDIARRRIDATIATASQPAQQGGLFDSQAAE